MALRSHGVAILFFHLNIALRNSRPSYYYLVLGAQSLNSDEHDMQRTARGVLKL